MNPRQLYVELPAALAQPAVLPASMLMYGDSGAPTNRRYPSREARIHFCRRMRTQLHPSMPEPLSVLFVRRSRPAASSSSSVAARESFTLALLTFRSEAERARVSELLGERARLPNAPRVRGIVLNLDVDATDDEIRAVLAPSCPSVTVRRHVATGMESGTGAASFSMDRAEYAALAERVRLGSVLALDGRILRLRRIVQERATVCTGCWEAGHPASRCPDGAAPGSHCPACRESASDGHSPASCRPRWRTCSLCRTRGHAPDRCKRFRSSMVSIEQDTFGQPRAQPAQPSSSPPVRILRRPAHNAWSTPRPQPSAVPAPAPTHPAATDPRIDAILAEMTRLTRRIEALEAIHERMDAMASDLADIKAALAPAPARPAPAPARRRRTSSVVSSVPTQVKRPRRPQRRPADDDGLDDDDFDGSGSEVEVLERSPSPSPSRRAPHPTSVRPRPRAAPLPTRNAFAAIDEDEEDVAAPSSAAIDPRDVRPILAQLGQLTSRAAALAPSVSPAPSSVLSRLPSPASSSSRPVGSTVRSNA